MWENLTLYRPDLPKSLLMTLSKAIASEPGSNFDWWLVKLIWDHPRSPTAFWMPLDWEEQETWGWNQCLFRETTTTNMHQDKAWAMALIPRLTMIQWWHGNARVRIHDPGTSHDKHGSTPGIYHSGNLPLIFDPNQSHDKSRYGFFDSIGSQIQYRNTIHGTRSRDPFCGHFPYLLPVYP